MKKLLTILALIGSIVVGQAQLSTVLNAYKSTVNTNFDIGPVHITSITIQNNDTAFLTNAQIFLYDYSAPAGVKTVTSFTNHLPAYSYRETDTIYLTNYTAFTNQFGSYPIGAASITNLAAGFAASQPIMITRSNYNVGSTNLSAPIFTATVSTNNPIVTFPVDIYVAGKLWCSNWGNATLTISYTP